MGKKNCDAADRGAKAQHHLDDPLLVPSKAWADRRWVVRFEGESWVISGCDSRTQAHNGSMLWEVIMPIYQLENIPEEFVTPKHSTAYGRLITGTQVEVGLLRYKAGEGAKQHAHPHEQVLLVLSGKCRLTLDGKPTIIGSGMAALIPPNTPHALEVLEDDNRLSRFPRGLFGVAHRAVAPRRRPGGGSAAV